MTAWGTSPEDLLAAGDEADRHAVEPDILALHIAAAVALGEEASVAVVMQVQLA